MIERKLIDTAAMSGGTLNDEAYAGLSISGVCIDSRKVQPGNLYVPLAGARADGHDFIEQVKEKKAGASFWRKDLLPYPKDIPLILVDDPLKAMQLLAKSYLTQVNPCTIGITGSNGKTSTKDFMCSVLNTKGKAQKTQGNHNNEIGLPMTILELDDDCQYAVLEMGMENFGDIPFLTDMAPLDLGIIVSIGSAHMENFGSRKEIARGKLEIMQGIKEGGALVYHKDSSEIEEVLHESGVPEQLKMISFGTEADLGLGSEIEYTKEGISFMDSKQEGPFVLPVIGDYQASNALAVIAAAKELGLDARQIQKGLAHADMTGMRGTLYKAGKASILDDSYKSNPESAKAALDTLMKIPADRHVAVLADMLDLGPRENELHASVGEYAKELGVDEMFVWGPRSSHTANAFGQKAHYFETKEELLSAIEPLTKENAAVLVKGSRYFKMDEAADRLRSQEIEMKKRLGVVFGGQSSEYSVSLHSAGSFLHSLHEDQYDLTLIGIAPDGQFYIYDGSIEDLEHDHWKEHARPAAWVYQGVLDLEKQELHPLDVVFPVLHGKNGEDGAIQGLLQMLNIHYVGCDVLSSAMNMDKEIMHILLRDANIGAADYVCLKKNEPMPSFEELCERMPLPWVVKPCNAGSSYGVSFVENKEQFGQAVEEAFKYDGRGKILVEEAIDGFEIGCAVMGNDDVFAGSVDEIETSRHLFDFEGKYEMTDAAIYCPARISKEEFETARALAKDAYKAMNCQGLARVDMFRKTDGTIIINEINTIPGMTATSRYPSMMKDAGKEFADLIDELIDLAMEKPVGVC